MVDLNTSGMTLFSGLCCCNNVIYMDFPGCLGCSGITECLCVHNEFCLKPNGSCMPCICGPADGYYCKLGVPCWACGIKCPTVLIKTKAQCCCCVGNVALPPDSDTPVMFAMLGLVLYPVCGFCMKLSSVH